jgi:hypothetical protein
MRLIKLGIISLIVFGVIIFLFSLLIPSKVRISRAMNIVAPKDSISGYIADIRTWQHWNEMIIMQDSNRGRFDQRSYSNEKLTVRLLSANPDSVRTSWKHAGSDAILSGFNLVQSLSDTTVAQWYFDFELKWYPWEKFGSIVFDQQLGPSMEKSLNNLKTSLEATAH